LKESFLSPYFEKMNVSSALSVFNHGVAAGIEYLILKGKIDKKHFTTPGSLETF